MRSLLLRSPKKTLEYFTMNEPQSMDEQIEKVLDRVRPFLQREGGDITYIGFKDGIVYVSMIGACAGCAYAGADISEGIEVILMEEIPGIIQVDGSGMVQKDVMDAYIAKEKAKQDASLN